MSTRLLSALGPGAVGLTQASTTEPDTWLPAAGNDQVLPDSVGVTRWNCIVLKMFTSSRTTYHAS